MHSIRVSSHTVPQEACTNISLCENICIYFAGIECVLVSHFNRAEITISSKFAAL